MKTCKEFCVHGAEHDVDGLPLLTFRHILLYFQQTCRSCIVQSHGMFC